MRKITRKGRTTMATTGQGGIEEEEVYHDEEYDGIEERGDDG